MSKLKDEITALANNEVTTDILLICANKPANYSDLNTFSFERLWQIAKSFAISRNHGRQATEEAMLALQEAIMYERLPEPIGLGGIDITEQLSGALLYYAREKHFQDTLYELCKDRIEQSILETLGTSKAKKRECQVIRVYVEYLSDIVFNSEHAGFIRIDVDKFRHYYERVYEGAQMPHTLTSDIIIEILQQARLGYEYDGKFYPFWYSVRGQTGRQFRQMVLQAIAARS